MKTSTLAGALIVAVLVSRALTAEKKDWWATEDVCRRCAVGTSSAQMCIDRVERTRRVTWRSGVIGAYALTALLFFANVIQEESLLSAMCISWIVITSCMNFRAYHVEDEGSLCVNAKLKE